MPNWVAAVALGFLVTMIIIAVFHLPALAAVLIGAVVGGLVFAEEQEQR